MQTYTPYHTSRTDNDQRWKGKIGWDFEHVSQAFAILPRCLLWYLGIERIRPERTTTSCRATSQKRISHSREGYYDILSAVEIECLTSLAISPETVPAHEIHGSEVKKHMISSTLLPYHYLLAIQQYERERWLLLCLHWRCSCWGLWNEVVLPPRQTSTTHQTWKQRWLLWE